MSRRKLTPYQRIVRAAEAGKGVRFSAEEVQELNLDEAVRQCAANDDFRDKTGEELVEHVRQYAPR